VSPLVGTSLHSLLHGNSISYAEKQRSHQTKATNTQLPIKTEFLACMGYVDGLIGATRL